MPSKLTPWYHAAIPRAEVREGRSFDPAAFAIDLEQVVAGNAPADYLDPRQFFARTCFTRALREHTGMVLRRLAGQTLNAPPVTALMTQFGGGKTHTLATLYHIATAGTDVAKLDGVAELLQRARIGKAPHAKVAVFVGSAWDPQAGHEMPWIDLARQIAGDAGVAALGKDARQAPPGTAALGRIFAAADAPVLVLFDEVLNFINRHRTLAEPFHAFIQNLTIAMTATTHSAAVISLPRSEVEMTDFDLLWQERITKVVRRVAKDLIANDEAEISEVVRRRLFDTLGDERTRTKVAKAYADWCFERRAQLPPEWTAVDSANTETQARTRLRQRFAACYPFHPATLSVFQRKWQALAQFQQTRGTLAMLAQWLSGAYRDAFSKARDEPLITLGSAPLDDPQFLSTVLGQVGEERLSAAIHSDIAGEQAHARALDADATGALRDIHRRVGTTILFESSGGQVNKVAHRMELRFALGEPGVDTTSVDNAALTLEGRAYYLRKVGSDGFKIGHTPTLQKVVNDRRAALDEDSEIKPALRDLIEGEFNAGANIPRVFFPTDSSAITDLPRLTLVVSEPENASGDDAAVRKEIAKWTQHRGTAPRLYPGALVFTLKEPGRTLQEKVARWLAWQRVTQEVAAGTLGSDFDRTDLKHKTAEAKDVARDQIWGDYRYVVLADKDQTDGIAHYDLGVGHASSSESLCGRITTALKSQALLSESVGAGYVERNWPPALIATGAWPLSGLRQSFLNGTLTRLFDPDHTLKNKIVECVEKGEFGLASGEQPDATYQRIWFKEAIDPDEVTFEAGVFLLRKETAAALTMPATPLKVAAAAAATVHPQGGGVADAPQPAAQGAPEIAGARHTICIAGKVPPEMWNRMGSKLIPKLRSGDGLKAAITLSVSVDAAIANAFQSELIQIIEDLGINNCVSVSKEPQS